MHSVTCPRYLFVATKLLLLLVVVGVLLVGSQPVLLAQDDSTLYLPVIQGAPPPALYGTVTYEGKPIAGITIDLWQYGNSDRILVATTVTGSDGIYSFYSVPRLPSNQYYGAEFSNYKEGTTIDDRFVFACNTWLLDDYEGESVHLGDFDIDDIDLLGPANDSTAKLPVTFSWAHQATMPGEYFINLYSWEDSKQFQSPPTPGTMSYKLERLPEGFSYNKAYGWYVIFEADRSSCSSWDVFNVTFKK